MQLSRPEYLVEAVLPDLRPVWGYENDPAVVAEVITGLRLMRSGLPVPLVLGPSR
jgi:hypothetical protein